MSVNSLGGGPCGKDCGLPNNPPDGRFDTYDNALAAIYLTKRGLLAEARKVLDAFIALLYPTGDVTPGFDYGAGTPLPSRRSLTLLAAGYTEVKALPGQYEPWESEGVADGAVDTGNNAWVGMAFAHFAAASGKPCYSLIAHDLLAALVKSTQCADDLQGFGSRLEPHPANYRSTEHNIDMFALSRMLSADGDKMSLSPSATNTSKKMPGSCESSGTCATLGLTGACCPTLDGTMLGCCFEGKSGMSQNALLSQKRAGAFVRSMWAQNHRSAAGEGFNVTYATGTGGAVACDATIPTTPAAIDAQFWNLLADADPTPERKTASMAYSVREADESSPIPELRRNGLWATDTDLIGGKDGLGVGAVLQGVRFTTWGHGIQWENTGSAAMAMKHYLELYDKKDTLRLGQKISAARDSIKHLLAVYRSVPASVLGGNYAAWMQVSGQIFKDRYTPERVVNEDNHSNPYPGGSDTGIGWPYMRYPHAASTAWAGMLLMYQFKDGDEVNEDANPFAPPAKTVPDPQRYEALSHTCLPGGKAPAPIPNATEGGGAVCSAHPACAGRHLEGDCCPTEEGFLLGCCSEDSAPPAPPPVDFGAAGEGAAVMRNPFHPANGGQGELKPEACDKNHACASLGLTGACCPTSEGSMLGCCFMRA